MTENSIRRFYTEGAYANKNPNWDQEDSPWKAAQIAKLLHAHGRQPKTIVEIGCGAGGVMISLKNDYPGSQMTGYDIAPDLVNIWNNSDSQDVDFVLGDYLDIDSSIPDLTLLIDVLEHLDNPFDFLERLKNKTNEIIVHFPLDLSSISVFRETPLLRVRDKVGHLHFYTRGLAIALLENAGFEIIEARYTGAGFSAPQRRFSARAAALFRRFIFMLNRDFGARLLGGETLMVLARPKAAT